MPSAVLKSPLQTLKNFKDDHCNKLFGRWRSMNNAERRNRAQLVRLSAAVCGIEFCYAAETAFVSPTLLRIGVPLLYMSLIWCLSPILGFFLVPVFGSLSDRCSMRLGRRRPFILLLSSCIVLGLLLVPNGDAIGAFLSGGSHVDVSNIYMNNSDFRGSVGSDESYMSHSAGRRLALHIRKPTLVNATSYNWTSDDIIPITSSSPSHALGIFFTVLGVTLLDFSCDACQSPCRTYLLDVSLPQDHSTGLTTFTVMSGLGGSMGYIIGCINWDKTSFGESLGGHVNVVFMLVLVIYIICASLTVTAVKEVKLGEQFVATSSRKTAKRRYKKTYQRFRDDSSDDAAEQQDAPIDYGTGKQTNLSMDDMTDVESTACSTDTDATTPGNVSLRTYLSSIVHMPRSLLVLCVTNLFSWMSLVSYSLYFTDYVGQAVYGGDPFAPEGSAAHALYDDGVRMGSLAMSLYSLSCCVYSGFIDNLLQKFGAKRVYVCSQLVYTIGAAILSIWHSKVAVLLLSPSAGVMYATLFTMPYLLVARYHASDQFSRSSEPYFSSKQIRGLGTDVGLVSSMVFVAQFLLSSAMGSVVHLAGTTAAVMVSASILSCVSAILATQVFYIDL